METHNTRITREQTIEAPQTKMALDKQFVKRFALGDTAPSVKNLEKFIAANDAPTNILNFKDGQDGQTITILGDGQTTVVYGANTIITNTGVDKLLAANKVYRFTRFNSVWVEDA